MPAAVDEPRLIEFAREIAATGHPVTHRGAARSRPATSITPRTTDMIEDAADCGWRSRARSPAGDDRTVGMMGISFAGGLRSWPPRGPGYRDRVAFVLSFGGHGDLPRTLRYLCTGQQPDGTHAAAARLWRRDHSARRGRSRGAADQVQPLREAIRSFLQASRLDMVDKAKGTAEFARARRLARGAAGTVADLMT